MTLSFNMGICLGLNPPSYFVLFVSSLVFFSPYFFLS